MGRVSDVGYNTTIMLLNDALGDIERDGEDFARQLVNTVHRSVRGDKEEFTLYAGGHSVGYLMPTAHADVQRVYTSHGNWLWEVRARGESFERALTTPYMHTELTARCRLVRSEAAAVLKALGPKPPPQ